MYACGYQKDDDFDYLRNTHFYNCSTLCRNGVECNGSGGDGCFDRSEILSICHRLFIVYWSFFDITVIGSGKGNF